MRAYARAAVVGSANLSLSRKAGSRFLAVLAVSTASRYKRPGHSRARAFFVCVFLSRAAASGAPFCEWSSFFHVSGDAYCEVENDLLSVGGDLLRVARKSGSLRFRWVYRIMRDRSHRVSGST
jgi:hypothetical protein